jgi:hypothetical protein
MPRQFVILPPSNDRYLPMASNIARYVLTSNEGSQHVYLERSSAFYCGRAHHHVAQRHRNPGLIESVNAPD